MPSHIHNFLKQNRADRRAAARVSKPHDGMTKDQLWAALQSAEAQLKAAQRKASAVAHDAHNYAQAQSGDVRRQLFQLRDDAYECASIADASR